MPITNNIEKYKNYTTLLDEVFQSSVGLSNILDSEVTKEFTRRSPMKRTHRHVVALILVHSWLCTKIG